MLRKLICKITGHNLFLAGTCPFTGKTYDVCKKCLSMFIKDKVNEKTT